MLTVVTVNYNTSAYCHQLLAAIRAAGYPPDFIDEIVFVDNASRPEEAALLAELAGPGVRVLSLLQQTSFAAANNQAVAASRSPYFCLLNPDTLVVDQALAILVDYLAANPAAGAVGPQFWIDRGRRVRQPPNELPTLTGRLRAALAHLRPDWLRRAALRRARYALSYWRAREPRSIRILSGACIVTRRDVWQKLGGLDEAYPLYYEDGDYCRRVVAAGYEVVYLPAAEIVHFYNKSGEQDYAAALAKNAQSERHYFRRFYGPAGSWGLRLAQWLERRRDPLPALVAGCVDLGPQALPLTFPLPDGVTEPVYLELAASPNFALAAGCFFDGEPLTLTPAMWGERVGPTWFARVVDEAGRRIYGTWRFQVQPPPRPAAWHIRPPGAADEAGLVTLFNQVFRQNRGLAAWRQLYSANPAGQRHEVIAVDEALGLLGHLGSLPVRFQFDGRQLILGQLGDFMVHPAARGRRGGRFLFHQLIEAHAAAVLIPGREDAGYGIPNPVSFSSSQQVSLTAPYEKLQELHYLHRPTADRAPSSRLNLTPVADPVPLAEALWPDYAAAHPVGLVKDGAYFAWRYRDRPDKTYYYAAATVADQTVALLVLAEFAWRGEPGAILCDWLLPPAGYAHIGDLLNAAAAAAAAHGRGRLLCLFSTASAAYAAIKDRGYEETPAGYTLSLMQRPGHPLDLARLQSDWFFTAGDFDIY